MHRLYFILNTFSHIYTQHSRIITPSALQRIMKPGQSHLWRVVQEKLFKKIQICLKVNPAVQKKGHLKVGVEYVNLRLK